MEIQTFAKQDEFINAFFDPQYDKLLYGGAIRGGKTIVLLILLIMLCKLWPRSRHAIIRRDLPTLKRTVLPTYDKVVPTRFQENFNRSDLTVTFTNGSQLLFLSENITKDPELNWMRGLEVNTIAFEEMPECSQKTFWKAVERAGTWLIPEWKTPCPSKVIGSCNPDQGWVKRMFYLPWSHGKLKAPFFFLPAKIFDNPHIPEDYKKSLKSLPDAIYNMFVEGSWDAVDSIHQLVSWACIDACAKRVESTNKTRSMGVDVGREGPDPTVILILEGLNVIETFEYPKTKINEVVNLVIEKMKQYNVHADHVTVDAVGLGAGVVDVLGEKGYRVIAMVAGATKEIEVMVDWTCELGELTEQTAYKFNNWKSYSYWMSAELITQGLVGNFTNDKLRTDASAIWYFTPDERTIHVESKDDLKKRLGRSPDYWDAFTYAVWSWNVDRVREKWGGNLLVTLTNSTKKEDVCQ